MFLTDFVAYLRHIVDAQGRHPDPDKVRVVEEAPQPRCVSELNSFLGLLAFYSKYTLPQCSHPSMPYSAGKHPGGGARRGRKPSGQPRKS